MHTPNCKVVYIAKVVTLCYSPLNIPVHYNIILQYMVFQDHVITTYRSSEIIRQNISLIINFKVEYFCGYTTSSKYFYLESLPKIDATAIITIHHIYIFIWLLTVDPASNIACLLYNQQAAVLVYTETNSGIGVLARMYT